MFFFSFKTNISDEILLRDKTEKKHLYLRRLTAQLREKDMELAKLLEHKMKVMKEMVEVVNKSPNHIDDKEVLDNSNRSPLGNVNNPSQTSKITLPNPDYSNLVREQKDRNYYTKEQLLSAVQVSYVLLLTYSVSKT